MSGYTVYKHTSPSGKVYIGITKQDPAKRWGADGSGYKHSPHFLAAIKKYGWQNIRHDIVAEGLTQAEAERLEVEMIAQYTATDRRYGYNADLGGSVGAKHSAETRAKIGEANRNRVWTPEARQKLRDYKLAHPTAPETAQKIGDANRGRKHRPESIEKIRASHPGRSVKNLETGEVYASVMEASRATGLEPSKIVAVCRGRRKTTGGYRWGYEEVVA
jgi:hypothetical protein